MTPAPRGVAASLRGAPQRAHGSQAASAIGSDLVPTWTGQAAAHGGHAGLAEVERVFSTFMYHLLVGRAFVPLQENEDEGVLHGTLYLDFLVSIVATRN